MVILDKEGTLRTTPFPLEWDEYNHCTTMSASPHNVALVIWFNRTSDSAGRLKQTIDLNWESSGPVDATRFHYNAQCIEEWKNSDAPISFSCLIEPYINKASVTQSMEAFMGKKTSSPESQLRATGALMRPMRTDTGALSISQKKNMHSKWHNGIGPNGHYT